MIKESRISPSHWVSSSGTAGCGPDSDSDGPGLAAAAVLAASLTVTSSHGPAAAAPPGPPPRPPASPRPLLAGRLTGDLVGGPPSNRDRAGPSSGPP
jgi:hypothetical protein